MQLSIDSVIFNLSVRGHGVFLSAAVSGSRCASELFTPRPQRETSLNKAIISERKLARYIKRNALHHRGCYVNKGTRRHLICNICATGATFFVFTRLAAAVCTAPCVSGERKLK